MRSAENEPLAVLRVSVPLTLDEYESSAFVNRPTNVPSSPISIAGKPFSRVQNVSKSVQPYWTLILNRVTSAFEAVKVIALSRCVLPS